MKKLILITLICFVALPVFAVDYWGGPPPGTWNRGDSGSTYEHWLFNDPIPFGIPDIFDNPFGEPGFELIGGFEYGEYEVPIEIDPSGFIHGWHCIEEDGGAIVLTIPNSEFENGEKKIFLQITSSKGPGDITVVGFGNNPGGYTPGTWSPGLPQIQWPDTPPAPYGGQWYTYNYGLSLTPNPQSEIITIPVSYCTVIDQIVVDTHCSGTVPVVHSTLDQLKALYR